MYLSTLFTPAQCNSQPTNTFSGIGATDTYTFQVEAPWKVVWTAEGQGNFNLRANDPNSKDGLYVVSTSLRNGARHGETVVYNTDGTLYFYVNTLVDTTWTISVEK